MKFMFKIIEAAIERKNRNILQVWFIDDEKIKIINKNVLIKLNRYQ